MKPDRSLTTFLDKHRKKLDKARITVVLTCNATGTDRLPLWYIRKANLPNCFRAKNLRNRLETIRAYQRHNKKAQMNHYIMIEYLRWFNTCMRSQGKQVLLLMDNFSAHELAVELIEEAKELTNTKVMQLPLNATSVH